MKTRSKALKPQYEVDFIGYAFNDLLALKAALSEYYGRDIELRALSPTFYRLPEGVFDEVAIVQKPNSHQNFMEIPGSACVTKGGYAFVRDVCLIYKKLRTDNSKLWRGDVKFDAPGFEVEDIIPPKFHTTDLFASKAWELQRFSANGSGGKTTSLRFLNQNCKIRIYQKNIQLQKLADKNKATPDQLNWLAAHREIDVVRFELELRGPWCAHGNSIFETTADQKVFANEVASYFIRNCPAKVGRE
jgi:hypothetical protein